MASDTDIVQDAKEAFKEADDALSDNHERGLDDLRFARLGEQWPEEVARQRQIEGRPMLTVNRLPTFIRQVVNDARQNKPSIKTMPVDSGADPDTAEIFNGIIRHVENHSSADIAYDNAIENAVSIGFGYWQVGLDYAHDDTFDLDISIDPIFDPFSVYPDAHATSADGSDWMRCHVLTPIAKKQFEREYPDAEQVGWSLPDNAEPQDADGNRLFLAQYWVREEVKRDIIALSDGSVVDVDRLEHDEELAMQMAVSGVEALPEQTRTVATYKVRRYLLNDSEVLEQEDWPGRFIPVIPVYGDEVNEQGKRHFRSLIRDAKDPQRMLNYWRTQATELVALAPRVPFIGPASAFTAAPEKWATANTQSHPYLEYDDKAQRPPQRQPMDSSAVGAMQQALSAADDIKSVMGIFDAALGAQGNETSGRAIIARQREGDTSTFHFIDNLTRSIRQSGRILIDIIPHVWNGPRVVRLMGEDGTMSTQPVNQEVPLMDQNGQPQMQQDQASGQMVPVTKMIDLTVGKYDLQATAGPSFTTKREEAAQQMIEMVRAFPAAAPVIGDLLAKNLDWPGADEIAERLKALVPQQAQSGIPPEIMQAIEQGKQIIGQLQQENEQLKADKGIDAAKLQIEGLKAKIDAYNAETKRLAEHVKAGGVMAQFARPYDLNGGGPANPAVR